jgi:hypothetical protein
VYHRCANHTTPQRAINEQRILSWKGGLQTARYKRAVGDFGREERRELAQGLRTIQASIRTSANGDKTGVAVSDSFAERDLQYFAAKPFPNAAFLLFRL